MSKQPVQKITGAFPLDSERWPQALAGKLRILIGVPFIYSIFLPMLGFDICLEIYHRICFPIFGIPRVKRSEYFIFDRHKLPYLIWWEKLNCLYCSYFNNLMGYAQEIGARTERHWCPIKHAMKRMRQHDHYQKFFEYNDGEQYLREHKLLRLYDDPPETSK